MKIAIITNNYKPYSGGVVSSITTFADQLKKIGCDVSIITLDFLSSNSEQEEYVFRVPTQIKFLYHNNHMAVPLRADKYIFEVIKKISPDIIHSQHPFLLGSSALKTARILNIPIVFTYHSQYEQYSHYLPFPFNLAKPVIKNIALSYCKKVNGIIAPSNSVKEILTANKISGNIEIISSGISSIFFNKIFEIKNWSNKFNLLYVGRFTKEKNIQFLLNVFSCLDYSKYKFNLVGYGSEIENLKNHAINLGIPKKNIEFIEKPSKDRLAQIYKDSNLFIFSSKTETQGLVLAEAMASSNPVIALDASGSKDIIKNNINGFLINSEQEMIEKIIAVTENLQLYNELCKGAWLTAQDYKIEISTERLLNFYKVFLS